jgi:hypothetical protein
VTFEMTDASFRVATCRGYEKAWWWLWIVIMRFRFTRRRVSRWIYASFLFSSDQIRCVGFFRLDPLDWSNVSDWNSAYCCCGDATVEKLFINRGRERNVGFLYSPFIQTCLFSLVSNSSNNQQSSHFSLWICIQNLPESLFHVTGKCSFLLMWFIYHHFWVD